MATCEKCWSDAYMRSRNDGRPQYEHYLELLAERKDDPCAMYGGGAEPLAGKESPEP